MIAFTKFVEAPYLQEHFKQFQFTIVFIVHITSLAARRGKERWYLELCHKL